MAGWPRSAGARTERSRRCPPGVRIWRARWPSTTTSGPGTARVTAPTSTSMAASCKARRPVRWTSSTRPRSSRLQVGYQSLCPFGGLVHAASGTGGPGGPVPVGVKPLSREGQGRVDPLRVLAADGVGPGVPQRGGEIDRLGVVAGTGEEDHQVAEQRTQLGFVAGLTPEPDGVVEQRERSIGRSVPAVCGAVSAVSEWYADTSTRWSPGATSARLSTDQAGPW